MFTGIFYWPYLEGTHHGNATLLSEDVSLVGYLDLSWIVLEILLSIGLGRHNSCKRYLIDIMEYVTRIIQLFIIKELYLLLLFKC